MENLFVMIKNLSFVVADIATYISFLPSLIALLYYNSLTNEQKWLAYLVWGGTIIGISALVIGGVFGVSNLFLLHIYTVFEILILTVIYRSALNWNGLHYWITPFVLFAIINSVFIEKLQTFNVLSRSISAFILMFYALSFFLKTLKEMKIVRLERSPIFWISVAVLFYNAGSFFIFLFSGALASRFELIFTYFGIHAVFTILLYIFYTIALWVRPET